MGVLDKFLDIMKLNDGDEDYDDDFFDDDYDDDYEEEKPKKSLFGRSSSKRYEEDEEEEESYDVAPDLPEAAPAPVIKSLRCASRREGATSAWRSVSLNLLL